MIHKLAFKIVKNKILLAIALLAIVWTITIDRDSIESGLVSPIFAVEEPIRALFGTPKPLNVVIVNKTGYPIRNLQAVDNDRNKKLITKTFAGRRHIAVDESYTVSLPPCECRITLTDTDGNVYTKPNLRIGRSGNVVFTSSDMTQRGGEQRTVSAPASASASAPASTSAPAASQDANRQRLTIVNRTGYVIERLHVSASSERTWGPDRLGSAYLGIGESFAVELPQADNYDIQLTDTDGDVYRKSNVSITNNTMIEFTMADMRR